LPTVTISSAWSITSLANPPRTAFVNYPLGHTTGGPERLDEQTAIVSSALSLLHSASEPGRIVPLSFVWPDEWKAKARGLGDGRSERAETPQYDRPADEAAVAGAPDD